MKFENKKIVLFDLDGTLVDSIPDMHASINHMMRALSKDEYSEDIIRGWVGNGLEVLIKRALSGTVDIADDINPIEYDRAKEVFDKYYKENSTRYTRLFDTVADTLKILKDRGYISVVITNKPYEFVGDILKAVDIDMYIDSYIGAGSTAHLKPHPEPLLYACNKYNLDISQAIMVGDSKNDILSAKNANIDSIAVSYGYNYGEDISTYSPTVVIDSFEQMLEYL
jgi:phosphoglycolate phosphatase